MSTHTTLSVVIPAYNEAARLPQTLKRVAAYLRAGGFGAHEIIVVDDGSTDRTYKVARAWARGKDGVRVLRLPKNSGKGAALRCGVLASGGVLVLCTDADLSTPIEETDKLLQSLTRGADVAIGSRHAAGSLVVGRPWYRRLLTISSRLVIRAALNLPHQDTQCGFKLYRREAALALFAPLSLPRFSYDLEVLMRAQALSLRVDEVGVVWRHAGQTSVRVIDLARFFIDIGWLRLTAAGLVGNDYALGRLRRVIRGYRGALANTQ